jgi:hypothetical protein
MVLVAEVAIILSIVASALVITLISVTLIRSGVEIVGGVQKYISNKKYKQLRVLRTTSLSSYIAMCVLFTKYRKDIKCKNWATIDISLEAGARPTTYVIPDGTNVKMRLEGGKIIVACGVGEFLILYKDVEVMKKLIGKMDEKYITKEGKEIMLSSLIN